MEERVRYIHCSFRRGAKDCGMRRKSTISLAVAFCAVGLCAAPAARANESEARVAIKRACLPQSETREEVKTRRLLEPFAVLKSAAAQFKAEALSARLCRLGDEFVYEIKLLHRDGRLLRVAMNATTGKLVGVRNAREPTPKI